MANVESDALQEAAEQGAGMMNTDTTVKAGMGPSGGRSNGTSRWHRKVMAAATGSLALASLLIGATPAHTIVPGPNGLIAFESNRDGNNDIYVMNPDGTVEENLTNHPANDVFPAWSPEGSRMTFSSDRHQPGNLDVYVMNADGTGVMQLTNSPGEDRGTSWTSDGGLIVFHSARDRDASHTFDIFVMKADGTDETKIFTDGSAAYVCGDSVNGTIVFNSSGDPIGNNPEGDFEIFTMNIDGSNVVQVTDNAVLDSGPKWSPDCSTISYNSLDSGGSLDVHRVGADRTNDVNLTATPGVFDAFSAWSPEGQTIVFSSNRDGNFEIYTMNAVDGSNVQRLTFTGTGVANLRADWGTAPARSGPPDPGPCTIFAQSGVITSGTAGDDVICGTAGDDRILGLGGNDTIFGLGGNDQLSGGDGNDTLRGGAGSDSLAGGAGNDRLYGGGGGVDRLAGALGDDYLNTVDGTADDYLVGGEHTDTCVADGEIKVACEL
jgi:Tol biopolymer transport system component